MAEEHHPSTWPSAEEFDEWYTSMSLSEAKDRIVQRHLGLPPDMLSSSLLPYEAVRVVVDELKLSHGDVLLDLACGRGGYGLEIARISGAALVGVDFSPVAVRLAAENAARHGVDADFRVGRLEATGLDEASVDGLVCVDAIQMCTDSAAAYAEMCRVLRPAGRAVLTTWQPVDPDATSGPMSRVRVRAGLEAAGFTSIAVVSRSDWLAREHALWEEAANTDPQGDRGLADLREEAEQVLPSWDQVERVIATAQAPA